MVVVRELIDVEVIVMVVPGVEPEAEFEVKVYVGMPVVDEDPVELGDTVPEVRIDEVLGDEEEEDSVHA
jgi:hypothetical protein